MATYAVQGDARGSPALRPALRDTERSPGSCSTTGTMSPRQCKESSFSLAPLRGIAPAEPRSRGSRSRPKTVPRAEAITHRPPRSFPRGARTAASSENPSAGFFLSTSLAHAALHGSAGAMAPGAVWIGGDLASTTFARERDLTPSQPYLARRPAIAQLARWPRRLSRNMVRPSAGLEGKYRGRVLNNYASETRRAGYLTWLRLARPLLEAFS